MKKLSSQLNALLTSIILATSTISTAQAATPLTTEDASTLSFMHQGEKLARDVYQTLHEKWKIKAFDNIAQSEQRHMEKLADQLANYELPNGITDDTVGAFSHADLQTMYDTLVQRGEQSVIDALLVGAYIEELDIMDLQKAIDATEQTALDKTYTSLMRGSRNHLRAFTRNLQRLGQPYTAQLMEQSDVDAIINTAPERHSQGKLREQRHTN